MNAVRRRAEQCRHARRPRRGRGRGESEDESGPRRVRRCSDPAGRRQRGGRRAARHAHLRRRRRARAGGERRRTVDYLPGSVNPEGSVSIIDLGQGVASASVRTRRLPGLLPGHAQCPGNSRLRARHHGRAGPRAGVHHRAGPHGLGDAAGGECRGRRRRADGDRAGHRAARPEGSLAARNALDPSDRDGAQLAAIQIAHWPVFGIYQPDAIASFSVGDQQFLVTANEGDSRSSRRLPGLRRGSGVGSGAYVLDPTVFPNAAALKTNAALGRLTVTNASGDTDGDGDFDRIQVFGARSFSIWTVGGQQVWDSGDQFERYLENPGQWLRGDLQRDPRRRSARQPQRQQGSGARGRGHRPGRRPPVTRLSASSASAG